MRTLLIALTLGGAAFAAPLSAQTAAPGLPWVGCWVAADGIPAQGKLCVIPEGENGLKLVAFDAAGATTESSIKLNGERVDVASGDCNGWEQARLTKDGDRVLIDAQIKCGESPQQKRSTAWVITPAGYWLQVNGAGISMVANASIRLYAPVGSYAEFPATIGAAIAPYAAEAERARFGAQDRIVSAGDLVELEKMGIATPVIDLVVAASYPKTFVIDAQGAMSNATADVAEGQQQRSFLNNPFYYANGFPMLSLFDMAMLQNCARFGMYDCSRFSMFGYSQFGYPPYGYGYFPGGYFPGYWPGYGLPVVVRPTDTPVPGSGNNGRVVRGQGYTSGTTTTGTRVAAPRSGTSGTVRSSGSSGSSTSSGSSAPRSSGTSGSTTSTGSGERTAKPRNP